MSNLSSSEIIAKDDYNHNVNTRLDYIKLLIFI